MLVMHGSNMVMPTCIFAVIMPIQYKRDVHNIVFLTTQRPELKRFAAAVKAQLLLQCSSSADVRATAMASIAQCLADPHLLAGIASSEAAFTTAPVWATIIGDSLLDPVPLACTAAHAATAQLMRGTLSPVVQLSVSLGTYHHTA